MLNENTELAGPAQLDGPSPSEPEDDAFAPHSAAFSTPTDVVLWTRYEYSIKMRPDGSGAAETRIVTWTPNGTDGTATLDRWTADHVPVALTPEQCQAAQLGLERSAERMREQADRGAFGEPTLGSMLVLPSAAALSVPASPTAAQSQPQPPTAPFSSSVPLSQPVPTPAPPATTLLSTRSHSQSHVSQGDKRHRGRSGSSSRSRSRSRSGGRNRNRSRSPAPRNRGRRRSRRSSPARRRGRTATPSLSPSPVPEKRRRRRSRSTTSSPVSVPAPVVAVPALRPEDAVRPAPKPKKATTAKPKPKQGAMAKQTQSWRTAWTFNTLPGSA